MPSHSDSNSPTAPLRVAVLAGGKSAERVVSLESGRQAAAALGARGHRIHVFDPAETLLRNIPWNSIDVCFLALHGGEGEGGAVQQWLTAQGIAYTGSGPAASRLAISKSASKERFAGLSVPSVPYVAIHTTDPVAPLMVQMASICYPVVVKPDDQGSSLGVNFADSDEELVRAIAASAQYAPVAIVEPWIDGREFTVALLGRRTLPTIEIATPRGLFDYDAKYTNDTTEFRFETGLSKMVAGRIENSALAACAALGTSGLARVDVMLDRDDRAWVLEVNTIPGLTSHSLAPKAAARAGFDFPALCDWMIRDCLVTEQAR